jgi:protein-tyrosine phosphatase
VTRRLHLGAESRIFGLLMRQLERRLPLEGACNVRDLGGYEIDGGGSTRWNRFLRGDSPHRLTASDVRILLDYGLRTVIDLREPAERRVEPSRLEEVAGLTAHRVPLLAELFPFLPGGRLPMDLGELYVLCLRYGAPALRRTFEILGRERRGAALFHCAAGKDRTGVVAALLLDLAGSPRQAILEDYTASEANMKPFIEQWLRQYREDPTAGWHPDLFSCRPQNMERMLDLLHDEYGGAAGYLRRAGLEERTLRALRMRMLGSQ